MESSSEQIKNTWEERWRGSEEKERISPLGKMMFSAKKQAIRSVLRDIQAHSMIEIGCGLGHTLSVFADKGLDAYGIDISHNAVAVCQKKGLNVEQKSLSDVTSTFDLVSSDGLLEHFLDFNTLVRDMVRISSKYVLIIQPNHDSFTGKTLAYASELIKGDANVFEYNYRISDFIDAFSRNGCTLAKSLPVFFNVFRLLFFIKK